MPYSPSQTRLFSRCAYKWYLERHLGLRHKAIGKREMAACVGSAVGTALACYYKGGSDLTTNTLAEVAENRFTFLVRERLQRIPGSFIALEEAYEQYRTFPRQLVEAYFKAPTIPPDWTVTGVEERLSDTHESYLDVAGTCTRGRWVLDFKCKMNVRAGNVEGELLKYANDSQLLQYVQEYRTKYPTEPVDFYRIVLLVASPKCLVTYADFEVNETVLAARHESNHAIWAKMDAARTALPTVASPFHAVPMAADHYDGIFKCDMYDICMSGIDPLQHPAVSVETEDE
jgi:hypothetical protein